MASRQPQEFDVVLVPQPEGGFTVTVPALPDVVTEGDTREEALEMARDAIEGYLACMQELGWSTPQPEHTRVTVQPA